MELSDTDFDIFIRWVRQRLARPRPHGRKADELDRRAALVLKKINRKYGTE